MEQRESHLPVAVWGMEINGFNGIKKTNFNLGKTYDWIFLTGENGFGKTSILQALAIVLNQGREAELKYMNFNVSIKVNLFENVTFNDLILQTTSYTPIHYQNNQLPPTPSVITPLACYGSSRVTVLDIETGKLGSPISGLFETRAIVQNIEFELSRWFFKKDDDEEFLIKYNSVTKAIKSLIPNLKEIKIDKKTDQVTYIEYDETGNDYPPMTFNQLAIGYRSIIGLIGDMIIRLYEAQDTHDCKDLYGIVIIDEIDLHFHPNIQREFPSILSRLFPKVQFICSTHSPIPILGAPKNSAFIKVDRNVKKGIQVEVLKNIEIKNLTPNTILTSPIFGFKSILAKTHSGNTRIKTEDTYEEMKFNDEVEKKLKKLAKENEDEFDGMFNEDN